MVKVSFHATTILSALSYKDFSYIALHKIQPYLIVKDCYEFVWGAMGGVCKVIFLSNPTSVEIELGFDKIMYAPRNRVLIFSTKIIKKLRLKQCQAQFKLKVDLRFVFN